MKKHHHIVIAGAGGIAEAAGILLVEKSEVTPTVYVGDRDFERAKYVANWIKTGTDKSCEVIPYHLPEEGVPNELKEILKKGEMILDCLPGSVAPRIAGFAKEYGLHYANLTEYVAETDMIMDLARDADTGFVLQTGLAPGYIDVLANGMFNRFCADFGVSEVDKVEMKVGALTDHAVAPHFYGFTWSPVGVATEYVKDAIAIRDFKKTILPALSETETIIIDGITYEDDLTSGGAADLPDALAGKVKSLDYKTLRYPGHYGWVKKQLNRFRGGNKIEKLQKKMETLIPRVEDDRIIVYAAVEGKDSRGVLQRREVAKLMRPMQVGKRTLRAIQTTTAVPLLQSAQMLLEGELKGVILQSQIDPVSFLGGSFVVPVYGEVDWI